MRKIEDKLVKWLDAKLAVSGFAKKALEDKNPRALMIEAAKVCVGIREATGRNDGPMVSLFQETIGKAEGEAWCASFLMSMIAYAELKTGVKSDVFPSEHCMTIWNKTPRSLRVVSTPAPGAIVIWRKGTSAAGHTGIVLECDQKSFEAIEGNTEKGLVGGKIERDGGGVYHTTRSRYGTGNMRVVGFLKPFPTKA